MTRPAAMHIELDAFPHNLARIRSFSPKSKVLAMVKANAYGHGLSRSALALADADAFGVACLQEAMAIRQMGLNHPIILMSGFFESDEIADIVALNCEIVVHSFWQVDVLKKTRLSSPLKVWLKIDTGMHRLGFCPEEFGEAYARLRECNCVQDPINLMTHFSDADRPENDKTREQIEIFNRMVHDFPGEKSLANSAGILAFDGSHSDWIRPGIMLYGVSPFEDRVGYDHGLKPVMSLTSRLIAIRQCHKNDKIGYGGNWSCPENMPIGIIALGYGDGYPRHAKNGTPVLVGNQVCPLVGHVSMDMLAVDLRSHPKATIGDFAMFWGVELPVEYIARHADTIPYELLTHVTPRLQGFE